MAERTLQCTTRQGALSESQQIVLGSVRTYEMPETRLQGTVYLEGPWLVQNGSIVRPSEATGQSTVVLAYSGTAIRAVMDADAGAAGVDVFRDGYPVPERSRGADVMLPGRFTVVEVTGSRAYELVRDQKAGEHELRLSTRSAGLRISSILLTECSAT